MASPFTKHRKDKIDGTQSLSQVNLMIHHQILRKYTTNEQCIATMEDDKHHRQHEELTVHIAVSSMILDQGLNITHVTDITGNLQPSI